MKCPRCEFENIPGQDECVRCGSILEISTSAVDVNPPRMPKWKKPLRSAIRKIRKARILPHCRIDPISLSRIKSVSVEVFLGLSLFIVPGLAHLVSKRFKEIRWLFLAWLISILLGFLLYPASFGLAMLGLAVGVHAFMALQYNLLRYLKRFGEKIFATAVATVILALLYRWIFGMLLSGLAGTYTSLSIPYYDIRAGDYLLARRGEFSVERLSRGSLVLMNPVTLVNAGRTNMRRRNDLVTVGEIIGLPGETVEIQNGVFIVDSQQLDSERYPVPAWLRNREISVNVSDDHCFVSSEYLMHGRGRPITDQDIRNVCAVNTLEIQGRVFMKWHPLRRRGFLR